MTDTTTQRLLPLLCFSCGMPVNHKQTKFDELMLDGVAALQAFEQLGVKRMCCRVVLSRTAVDPRLRRRFKEASGFVTIQKMPRIQKSYTLLTDGSTEPLE